MPKATLHPPTPESIRALAQALIQGELVAAPTETVYGLAGNALSAKAAKAIFRAKGRPATDPLIVHIASLKQLSQVAIPNREAQRAAHAFWPGPLTLILPKTDLIPPEVTSGGDSVAVRMPAHPLFRRLLLASKLPLAAPSANPFGYVSPTTAQHVMDGLGSKIPHVLDGGSCSIGVESTILDLREPTRPRILRPGAISAAQIRKAIGRPVIQTRPKIVKGTPLAAPGLLKRHYSPRTPVILHPSLSIDEVRPKANEAWIFLKAPKSSAPNVLGLDPKGSLDGVARSLFAVLRAADKAGYRKIHIERARGSDGLAAAINDRLERAAAR